MQSKLVRVLGAGVFLLSTTTIAIAQQNVPSNQSLDLGKSEYEAHCAVCHGLNGTGAPYILYLTKTAPNLATLSNRNGGVFPFQRVYEIIDGRQEMKAHGPRDMPIWGREYVEMASKPNQYNDRESFVRAKILALTEYVYRLQAK